MWGYRDGLNKISLASNAIICYNLIVSKNRVGGFSFLDPRPGSCSHINRHAGGPLFMKAEERFWKFVAWMETRSTPEKLTVKEIIVLTKGAYGSEQFAGFFKVVA